MSKTISLTTEEFDNLLERANYQIRVSGFGGCSSQNKRDMFEAVIDGLFSYLQGYNEEKGKFDLWFGTVVRNSARRVLKESRTRNARYISLDNSSIDLIEGSSDSKTPLDILIEKEEGPLRKDRLQNALKNLPEKNRQAIQLRYDSEGGTMPYVKIAKILGITTEAARKRCTSALDYLQQFFKEE